MLVFTRTKHGANRLAEYLTKHGLPAAAIHGNKSQNARTKALADFKANDVRILVATDIAARGLDIDQLPHVVNYELPNVEEDYVHRIGRTGRAGRSGEAISLVAPDEEKLLKAIEKMTRQRIPDGDAQGFDPEAVLPEVAQPEPAKRRSSRAATRNGAAAASASRKTPRRATPTAMSLRPRTVPRSRLESAAVAVARTRKTARPAKRSSRGRAAKRVRPSPIGRRKSTVIAIRKSSSTTTSTISATAPTTSAPTRARKTRDADAAVASRNPRAAPASRVVAKARAKLAAEPGRRSRRRSRSGCRPGQGEETARRQAARPGSRECLADERRALREPSEYGTGKQPSRQPVVINKRDLVRMDRFPTAEQLDELEPRRKGERPALLTRNR